MNHTIWCEVGNIKNDSLIQNYDRGVLPDGPEHIIVIEYNCLIHPQPCQILSDGREGSIVLVGGQDIWDCSCIVWPGDVDYFDGCSAEALELRESGNCQGHFIASLNDYGILSWEEVDLRAVHSEIKLGQDDWLVVNRGLNWEGQGKWRV